MSADFESRLRQAIQTRAKFIGPRFKQFPDALERIIEIGTFYLGYRPEDHLPAQRNSELVEEVQSWISEVLGGPSAGGAFTDGTTLYSVDTLLTHKSLPHPELLYDLATFVEGAVLFDRIFHLKNPGIEDDIVFRINEAIGCPLVISVPIDWQKHDPYWGGRPRYVAS
jgi:hypothetical protein